MAPVDRVASRALELAVIHDPPGQAPAAAGWAVHVAGHLTAPLMSYVLPTVNALGSVGVPQMMLFVDDAQGREQAAALPPTVRPVPVSGDDRSPWQRCRSLLAALQRVSAEQGFSSMYLHGLLPALATLRLLRSGVRRPEQIFFSPHGAHALVRPTVSRVLLGRLLEFGLRPAVSQSVVNLQPEARLMAFPAPLPLIECPAADVFFETPRNEAMRPLLISCNLEGRVSAVEAYARIAVLLDDERLGLSFNWVGPADADARALLRAAGIGEFDVRTDAARAVRLSAAWIYVAASDTGGFPVRLVEAMAAGLPCVALDTPSHRSVITDGDTGLLCAEVHTMLQRIAQLADSAPQRQALGAAARRAASLRFSEAVFRDRLLPAAHAGTSAAAA